MPIFIWATAFDLVLDLFFYLFLFTKIFIRCSDNHLLILFQYLSIFFQQYICFGEDFNFGPIFLLHFMLSYVDKRDMTVKQ